MEWQMDQPGGSSPGENASFFTALEEQLGLKIVMKKFPTDVLVVDQIERPSED
jgi:uncharacterized protein (TIGR03435 family)